MRDAAITLILCSRNGSRTIRNCLDHIGLMEEAQDAEIVLVDNGSTDDTLGIMQEFCSRNPDRWRAILERRPGNSAGRNAGILHSSGKVILFIDDDCYPDKAFVVAWKKIFAQHPDLGFGTGRIMPFDERHSTLGCNISLVPKLLPPNTFVRRGFVQGSNMAFSRRCLFDAGLFDNRFGAGTPFAGEEWELVIRASYAGWRGGYFPEPSVNHDHGRSESDASIRERYYDLGAGAVYAKHLLTQHAPATAIEMLADIRRHFRRRSIVKVFMEGAKLYYDVRTR